MFYLHLKMYLRTNFSFNFVARVQQLTFIASLNDMKLTLVEERQRVRKRQAECDFTNTVDAYGASV